MAISEVSFQRPSFSLYEPIALATDGVERTRTDLITYASQFVSASLTAGEKLFQEMPGALCRQGLFREMDDESFRRLVHLCEDAKERFIQCAVSTLKGLSHNAQLIGFSQPDALLYDSLMKKMEKLTKAVSQDQEAIDTCSRELTNLSQKISAKLSSSLLYSKELKLELIQSKEAILALTKEMEHHFQQICLSLIQDPFFQKVSEEKRSLFVTGLQKMFHVEMNKERSRILLSAKEWDRDLRTNFPYAVQHRLREAMVAGFTSSFRAAGPAYCSQLPRNRTPDHTTLINFFYTAFNDRAESLLHMSVESTRSGTIVESSQVDQTLRHACTLKHIQQLATTHAEHALENMRLSQGVKLEGHGTEQEPYRLPITLVTLLTPDLFLHIKTMLGKSPLADDGRAHLDELIRIYEEYQRHPLRVTVGKEATCFEIDFRYLNVPSKNDYDERRQSRFFKGAVRHAKGERVLQQSVRALLVDAGKYRTSLNLPVQLQSSAEQEVLRLIKTKMDEKETLRRKLSKIISSTGRAPDKELIQQWQKMSDALIASIDTEQGRSDCSLELKNALSRCLKASLIQDLICDLQELVGSRIYQDISKMDGNRFGFVARILMLTGLMSQVGHFCCNSGKDRTGLLDDELKLLLAETSASERLPAWFEQISWRHHRLNRKNVLEQAGSSLFIPKANIGNLAWLNLRGNRPVLPKAVTAEEKQEERALDEAYNRVEAASSITMKVELAGNELRF